MKIPVFKAGKHTDMSGNVRQWTQGDLDAIISSYDPSHHEAPVVIGHPATNAPAWGWVKGLTRTGDMLYAELKDLDPTFTQWLKDGRYRKRSISLNSDLSLRHIGFLGAMPPAVKGLPDVQFAADDTTFTIETEEKQHMSFMQKFKDLLKSEGVDVTDIPETKSFSEQEVQTMITQSVSKATEDLKKAYDAKEQAFAESVKAREDELKKQAEAIAAEKTKARKQEITAFCETLIKGGKLTPAAVNQGMGLSAFLESISDIQTIEFGEGDKKATQTPAEFMQAFLSSLPQAVMFGEHATRSTDPGHIEREKRVMQYMETNNASYRDAVIAIATESPEIFTLD